ncbi:MAG: succinyldiaminopimelate transaminase [Arcanobacterium sp.]|nr:succinyldiaminopimelate transaminase [Arcanobacterium sp.]
MPLYSDSLPDFPWDTLVPIRERAARHPEGSVDLTIGSPVDPVPPIVIQALGEAADAHAYPPNLGSEELHEAIHQWMVRERGITSQVSVIPTLGSKEMVALLPSMLGLGSGSVVAFPRSAYPTYEVGARLAGAQQLAVDPDTDPNSWPTGISMLWLNSPGNPDGHVLDRGQLRRIIRWARDSKVILASDECYAAFVWDAPEAPSLLNDDVCGGDTRNLLMLYSTSKQSNMAGYRGAFIAGDPLLIEPLGELRKHSGFMMPSFVAHAMAVALKDTAHVKAQREIYARRRNVLLSAAEAAGLHNDPDSVGGLYLWLSAKHPDGESMEAWAMVRTFAELGIVVAPGTFYGNGGAKRVRVSLTASDADIRSAAHRLGSWEYAASRV